MAGGRLFFVMHRQRGCTRRTWAFISVLLTSVCHAADVIPHAQDKPPNAPYDPQTAIQKMTVPDGFVVELVASEPQLINPVAMAIDEKGRFWITESIEYPRAAPGHGQDRVKILTDTDDDGKADHFQIFLDGLNIPSGVQVGFGGVWIANAPDILFVPDRDRDGQPDGPAEVVVTGFGRTDTHELPNSLTWGPDGWLYGLNGVFNHSHVKYVPGNPNYSSDHPGWVFTCAMFRIHPRTREFQVVCEGTSNPWGIAFDDEGEAFVSACVIDHLWHLVPSGYYHRQGGPYPPHTWKIDSIVKHKHQKAAYCGITWFDSDAYPPEYRRKLYMGNIHGGCINVDRLERRESTYAGFGEPDFLTANDAWFMPVVQKTGPDGCLYILDWYDRYHCYQDANRDPAGIDRQKGRLYRVRWVGANKASARGSAVDLAQLDAHQLIQRLDHPNVWQRETAQRLLQEQCDSTLIPKLIAKISNPSVKLESRRRALWVLLAYPQLEDAVWQTLWEHADDDPVLQAWMLRGARQHRTLALTKLIAALTMQPLEKVDPRLRLQLAITVGTGWPQAFPQDKPGLLQRWRLLIALWQTCGNDPLLPRIIWQNMLPLLRTSPEVAIEAIRAAWREQHDNLPLSRIIRWYQAEYPALLPAVVEAATSQTEVSARLQEVVTVLIELTNERSLSTQQRQNLLAMLRTSRLWNTIHHSPSTLDAATIRRWKSLLLLWGESIDPQEFRDLVMDPSAALADRVAAWKILLQVLPRTEMYAVCEELFRQSPPQSAWLSEVLASLATWNDPQIGKLVLTHYSDFSPELQPRAIEMLSQRPSWARELLLAMERKAIPPTALSVSQARRIYELKDDSLKELLTKVWGQLRESQHSDRELVVAQMKQYIRHHPGDPQRGEAVFRRVCAQCHKIYGEGAEVGPDLTSNGRNDYQQLLSNVFDPNLVIGAGYRAYTVATEDGRVINGLLVEDSPQRVVLKVQGGKLEVIPRDQIEVFKISEVSLMPEQLERQISLSEIADLFAFLTLDRPPHDPAARRLAGVYDVQSRESQQPEEYASIFQEVAPGFTKVTSGEGGVALLAEFRGRKGVVRTHPVSRDRPAEMQGTFEIPTGQRTWLVFEVSHDLRGDWRLVATAGEAGRLLDELVNAESCPDGWGTFRLDLTRYAGQRIPIRMWNQANDWYYEFAYWGSVRLESEPLESSPNSR
ncbi:MAG: hypothetical protein KatS3mg113_0767 [Planctomycetaceae bacterium]|nr:MAG: hypothetical protein KatS3mg113_0767 [Planctomycetaceae bacterium]